MYRMRPQADHQPRRDDRPGVDFRLDEDDADADFAFARFDRAVDPELVESCIYHINAVKARCNYLIRRIKQYDPDAIAAARPEGDTVWI